MHRRITFLSLCGLSLAILHPVASSAQMPPSAVAAQYHFSGSTQFSSDANFAKLKQIAGLPATLDLRDAATHKFAGIIAKALTPRANENSPGLLQPLLNDLLENESVASFGGRSGAPLGFALAVRLDAVHTKVWENNLTQLFGNPPAKITAAEFPGLQWGTGSTAVRLVHAKDWLVVSGGDDLVSVQNQLLASLRQQGRPAPALQGNILQADVDWVRLAQWVPSLSSLPLKLGRTQVTVADKADNLHTTLHVHYPEALGWKTKPWQIPTDVIYDPIVSFTSCQNLGVLLRLPAPFTQIHPNPFHDEFFIWAQADIPFQTLVLMPASGSTNVLKALTAQLPALFNTQLKESHRGEIKWVTERQELTWQGLLLVVPYLKASSNKTGECLMGGFFPLPPGGKPVPTELFSQVTGRNNLIYYDWELTGARLQQWRSLSQMLPIFNKPAFSRANVAKPGVATTKPAMDQKSARAARELWLTAITPLLGNTITEITSAGPNDVTVIRKSHIGFTGLELVLLSQWLTN